MSEPVRIPLCAPVLLGREREYVSDAVTSGWIAGGPYVTRFEESMREATGAEHAVGVVNGTAGLHVALRLAGVTAGDLVVVPSVTFVATVNAVRYLGADPVFMDCDEHLGMDAAKLGEYLASECRETDRGLVEIASCRRVGAVMPVHVFGIPCDMERIGEAAGSVVPVVEDAAESLGSTFTGGRFAGVHTGLASTAGVFSFNANKVVTCGGGGMIVTGDALLAERARYLIAQAKDDPLRAVHDEVGYNYRLSNLHAAVGLAQMEHLPAVLERREAVRELYRASLDGIAGLSWIEDRPGTSPNNWFFGLEVDPDAFGASRDDVMAGLARQGVESRPLWRCNHLQKPYAECRAYRIERAPEYESRVLNVPCGADLTDEDVRSVAAAIRGLGGR